MSINLRSTLYFLLSVFLSQSLVSAAEIPVNIKAEYLKFYEDSTLVEASGSVEVRLQDATIFADQLLMDSATNVVTAEGHVRLVAADYTGSAGQLVYDADADQAGFTSFEVVLRPSTLRGDLYLIADQFRDEGRDMSGRDVDLSTCQDAVPHYYLLADRLEYFPDDHLAASRATMYVGELPVFWLPYLYYDLKDQQRRNWTFGHNEIEGDFVKSSWTYAGGLLLLDYMTKKGFGIGTDTPYNAGGWGLGTLKLYNNNEADTGRGDWIEKLDHTAKLGEKTKLRLTHSYTDIYQIPSGRLDNTAIGLELTYASKESASLKLSYLDDRWGKTERQNLAFNQATTQETTGYVLDYNSAKDDPGWLRGSQRLAHQRALLPGNHLNFATTTNYYYNLTKRGDSGEEKLDPQVEFSGREKDFSWRLTQNWFVDLREDLSPGEPRYEFLEKQPELEVSPRPIDLKLFNLQSTIGLAKYHEVKYVAALGHKRDFTTDRGRTTLNANRSLPFGPGTTLALGAGIDQYLYAPGDQLYAMRESANVVSDNRRWWKNEIAFRQGYTAGNTPFFFDQLGTRYHDIREKMTFYYLNKFNWSFDGGHNWQTSKYFDVMTHLVYAPEKWLRLTLNTGWDIENTRYKDLVSSLRWQLTDFYGLEAGFTKDMNLGELKAASALHDLYLLQGAPNQWHLRFSQVLDPTTEELKVRDIMLVKDLHCWEMKFTYSDYRKEYSFVYTLKALPGEPVGFGSGRGFYYDGFERELGKLKPEEEIRRY
ncbi:MAG: hypothetical protein WC529_01720 [Candidatus Margulisiibacteriota bacterium]